VASRKNNGGNGFELEKQQAPAGGRAARSKQAKPAGKARSGKGDPQVLSYRHAHKRRNNPEVGMVTPDTDPETPKTTWAYDPHIDPALQFDSGRAQVEKLIDDALASGNEATMRAALEQLKRQAGPYLNWAGKAERTSFEVDTVSLHVHERIDPASILAAVRKRMKDAKGREQDRWKQPDLFAAPFENLPLRDAIDFYKHERGWANRLIAGDSLLVMNSLLQKEGMAGQVQVIYIDPPYGIKYGSNFQPFVNKRDVKDRKDDDLTQEPEMIKAFRDTWELGIHSYLTYLRDRLLLAKELLHESGSVFVQISDENLHHVREMLDELFGPENFCSVITIAKTAGHASELIANVGDYLVWYAKSKPKIKFHQPYREKAVGLEGAGHYGWLLTPQGERRGLRAAEKNGSTSIPEGSKLYAPTSLVSQGNTSEGPEPFVYCGKEYSISDRDHWKTNAKGLERLAQASRIHVASNSLRFVRFVDDFPAIPFTNLWDDTATGIHVPGDGGEWERLCNKMATGTGKTTVMAMLITWQVLNALTYPKRNKDFSRAVFIVAPGLSVKERLRVLYPGEPDNYYDAFGLCPSDALRQKLNQAEILIENWHALMPQKQPERSVVKKGEESDEAYTRRVLGKLAACRDLVVINDEAHHA
jgi:adenine-specific DNA-methyltransferase